MLKKLFILLRVLALLATAATATINVYENQEDFKNLRVLRVMDLTKSVVKEDIGIRAKNTGNQATDIYYFVMPIPCIPFIASYTAHLKQGTKDSLVMESIGLDVTQQMHVYKIHLKEKVEPDQDVKIGVQLVYTHLVRPLPEKIPQISKQHVSFANNIYLFSAYSTDEMKTTFVFPSSSIVTYVGGEESNHTGQKSENKIIYGIFNNINPYSLGAGNFHYEYQRPILTVTRLQRVLEVSHWAANLAVEDYYALKHDGAQLDEEFSRIKYQMPPHILEQTNVLNKLVFQLPKEASDVYYRDEVGNVSTSAYFNGVLELQPRFPLFGGWKTTWYTGYNAPLKNFVKKYKGEYILKAQFVENVQDNMAVDDVQLKVILPEGATDIKVTPPTQFEMDSIEHSVHYTYFDSTGRPAVTFYKKNVVTAHQQPLFVSYKYSSVKLLQKPLVVSGALFILCLFNILVSKVPWAMSEVEKEQVTKSGKITKDIFPKGTVLVDESSPAANTRTKKPTVVDNDATTTATKDKPANSRKKSKKRQ